MALVRLLLYSSTLPGPSTCCAFALVAVHPGGEGVAAGQEAHCACGQEAERDDCLAFFFLFIAETQLVPTFRWALSTSVTQYRHFLTEMPRAFSPRYVRFCQVDNSKHHRIVLKFQIMENGCCVKFIFAALMIEPRALHVLASVVPLSYTPKPRVRYR